MELSQQAMLQKFENLSCQHWHITLALIEEHHEIFCLTFVVELLRIHLDIWWQLWCHILASSSPSKKGHANRNKEEYLESTKLSFANRIFFAFKWVLLIKDTDKKGLPTIKREKTLRYFAFLSFG